jgi:hypothetical protein
MDFTLEKLGKQKGRQYIKDNHYSGGCSNAAMIWGLYDTADSLRGAIAFAVPISESMRKQFLGAGDCWCDHLDDGHGFHQHVTDLHRLYTDDDLPDGTETWFISQALDRLKAYKPKYWIVTAFADTTEGHLGTVYQASNAKYYGTSDEATFYRDQTGTLRHPRQCGENITKSEARERGWNIEKRDSKHRYLFLLPDGKRHRQWLEEELSGMFEEYPSHTDEEMVVAD